MALIHVRGISMGKKSIYCYHGTDYTLGQIICGEEFSIKKNDEHWLGNGIYFYHDLSLAEWWTTQPTSKFGSFINNPAIITCEIEVDEKKCA